ncbi:hypothetical protein DRF68_02185 [Candidatus Chryseobacterium massiliae]|uniref:Uncharacterized protein n=2 Tax=Chryseobacterium group TaxID=2782232 RepID=A0A3D9BG89_9FLAO|nr:hypothetical protein DRF68_02185 [Candidatus Chryseobacterium massiliae]
MFNCEKKTSDTKKYNFNKSAHSYNIKCNDSIIKKYESFFITRSENFIPSDINLYKSIESDRKLNSFIDSLKMYDSCFYKNEKLNYFITVLILKQYKFQLKNYHQGYDLFSMDKNNGKYIVEKYLLLLGKKRNDLEMLNSGYIVDYLSKKEYKKSIIQKNILNEIDELNYKLTLQQKSN